MAMDGELNKKEPFRFVLHGGKTEDMRCKAFEMMHELNKLEEVYERDGKKYKIAHRVGITTETQFILDIDNQDEKNLRQICKQLDFYFPEDNFTVVKTCHADPNNFGYQIISDVKEKSSFQYKHLKVLKSDLEREFDSIGLFWGALEPFLQEFRDKYPNPKKNQFNGVLIESGLIDPIGDFDFLYNVLAASTGKSSIRLTPKTNKDRWEVII